MATVAASSPHLDRHDAWAFDSSEERDYGPEADEFTLPIKLTSRTTDFTTTSIDAAASR